MTDTAPLVKTIERTLPATATGSDAEFDIAIPDHAATVSSVKYVTSTAITGADTNSRTVVLVNKGQSGSGTTVVATKAFTSGVNSVADDDTTITLSVVDGATTVAAGDVLAWQSTHVGTGLADPGGLAHVELTRA